MQQAVNLGQMLDATLKMYWGMLGWLRGSCPKLQDNKALPQWALDVLDSTGESGPPKEALQPHRLRGLEEHLRLQLCSIREVKCNKGKTLIAWRKMTQGRGGSESTERSDGGLNIFSTNIVKDCLAEILSDTTAGLRYPKMLAFTYYVTRLVRLLTSELIRVERQQFDFGVCGPVSSGKSALLDRLLVNSLKLSAGETTTALPVIYDHISNRPAGLGEANGCFELWQEGTPEPECIPISDVWQLMCGFDPEGGETAAFGPPPSNPPDDPDVQQGIVDALQYLDNQNGGAIHRALTEHMRWLDANWARLEDANSWDKKRLDAWAAVRQAASSGGGITWDGLVWPAYCCYFARKREDAHAAFALDMPCFGVFLMIVLRGDPAADTPTLLVGDRDALKVYVEGVDMLKAVRVIDFPGVNKQAYDKRFFQYYQHEREFDGYALILEAEIGASEFIHTFMEYVRTSTVSLDTVFLVFNKFDQQPIRAIQEGTSTAIQAFFNEENLAKRHMPLEFFFTVAEPEHLDTEVTRDGLTFRLADRFGEWLRMGQFNDWGGTLDQMIRNEMSKRLEERQDFLKPQRIKEILREVLDAERRHGVAAIEDHVAMLAARGGRLACERIRALANDLEDIGERIDWLQEKQEFLAAIEDYQKLLVPDPEAQAKAQLGYQRIFDDAMAKLDEPPMQDAIWTWFTDAETPREPGHPLPKKLRDFRRLAAKVRPGIEAKFPSVLLEAWRSSRYVPHDLRNVSNLPSNWEDVFISAAWAAFQTRWFSRVAFDLSGLVDAELPDDKLPNIGVSVNYATRAGKTAVTAVYFDLFLDLFERHKEQFWAMAMDGALDRARAGAAHGFGVAAEEWRALGSALARELGAETQA